MMKPGLILLLLAVATGLTSSTQARFSQPLTELVPTARLITNLEKQLTNNPSPPEKAKLHYELGRIHAIAAHQNPREFPTLKDNGRPSFGVDPSKDLPPDRSHPGTKGTQLTSEASQQHLKSAVTHYQDSLQLKPDDLPSQLGLAWCIDQQGNRDDAVKNYRKALALAWEREENANGIFHLSWVEEIAGYLEPLLDPEKDTAELQKVSGYRKVIIQKPRAITPLLIPMTQTTALDELINEQAGVQFDLDGSGLNRRWGWITPHAAWIVYDPQQQGKITSGLQLLGNVTFWVFWDNGYTALAALDNDGDKLLSGAELSGLALWNDVNSNGRSEPGEVIPIEQHGIASLSTRWSTHETGIPCNPAGVLYKDGRVHPSYDWLAPMN